MNKMKKMMESIEITGRVVRKITVGNSHVFQIDVTGSKSYYVLIESRPEPEINSEIQMKIEPVDTFYLNQIQAVLYQESY